MRLWVGCPELEGLQLDFEKAYNNGWQEIPSTNTIYKNINTYLVRVVYDANGLLTEMWGWGAGNDIYTCDCDLIPPPDPPSYCVDWPQHVIDQTLSEVTTLEETKNYVPLLILGVIIMGSAVYLVRR